MPVLPLVGSTIVPPGFSLPSRSAASMILVAMRSFEEPPGLKYSTFASTVAAMPCVTALSFTNGVFPTRSSTDCAYSTAPSLTAASRVLPLPSGGLGRPLVGVDAGGRQLLREQPRVHADGGDQLGMPAALHDPPRLDHVDDIRVDHRRQAVRDGDRRAPACGLVERRLHDPLRDGVQR